MTPTRGSGACVMQRASRKMRSITASQRDLTIVPKTVSTLTPISSLHSNFKPIIAKRMDAQLAEGPHAPYKGGIAHNFGARQVD